MASEPEKSDAARNIDRDWRLIRQRSPDSAELMGVRSKNSNLPNLNDLQGDEEIAPRPLARLSRVDELETNAGDHLRFG